MNLTSASLAGPRSNARRALFDPAQDRLGTFQVITPGHPLVPPRDPEVGQRTDKVMARCPPGGAHAADDDVERLVREPVLRPAAAQEDHVVDRDLVAPVGYRLTGPEQI